MNSGDQAAQTAARAYGPVRADRNGVSAQEVDRLPPTEAALLHLKPLRENFDQGQFEQRSPGIIRDHKRLRDVRRTGGAGASLVYVASLQQVTSHPIGP